MAPELNDADRDLLDQYLDQVLERLMDDRSSLAEARADLARAFTMAAEANRSVIAYMMARIESEPRG
jgi:hypothetical protein